MTKDIIKQKKAVLANVAWKLKQHFVGLDPIIDQIVESISVWYIMPELILRPVIISLWGMTGVGKTDLVRRLVREIGFGDKFLEIQMGNDNGFNKSIASCLSYCGIEEKEPGIILLDEIQRFRTLDANGNELDPDKFQDTWMLLSDGKFNKEGDGRGQLLETLLFDVYEKTVEEEPKTLSHEEVLNKLKSPPKKKKTPPKCQMSVWSAKSLKRQLKLTEKVEDIMQWTQSKKMEVIYAKLEDPEFSAGADYSKCLIFISGNLDEAYEMAHETENSDIDADILHGFSKKINLVSIKSALKRRFRPEQISRFGNTHIIYPSLRRVDFEEIIRKTLSETIGKASKETGVIIEVDKSINDSIYRNGVFPAQGVRPVFSTVDALISRTLPKILFTCLEKGVHEIQISFDHDFVVAKNGGKEIQRIFVEGSIDKIRRGIDTNQRTLVSIHEVSHAICFANLFKVVPCEIRSDMSAMVQGFMISNEIAGSKNQAIMEIAVRLAGMVGDELIFGKNYRGIGSTQDIIIATGRAATLVRQCGLFEKMSIVTNHLNQQADKCSTDFEETNAIVERLMQEGKKLAEEIISKNQRLLVKISKLLIRKGRLSGEEFMEALENSVEGVKIMEPEEKIFEDYNGMFIEFEKKLDKNKRLEFIEKE